MLYLQTPIETRCGRGWRVGIGAHDCMQTKTTIVRVIFPDTKCFLSFNAEPSFLDTGLEPTTLLMVGHRCILMSISTKLL
jgi:hypothetical protein